MNRIFERRKVWQLEWSIFHNSVELLACAIESEYSLPDAIVSIGRGGRELGIELAKRLMLPVHHVTARHNISDAIWSPAQNRVEVSDFDLHRIPDYERILVADDICGSGKTLEEVRCRLATPLSSPTIMSTVLCKNVGSVLSPDFWIWTVRDWVIFPWEQVPSNVITESLPISAHLFFEP